MRVLFLYSKYFIYALWQGGQRARLFQAKEQCRKGHIKCEDKGTKPQPIEVRLQFQQNV